MAIRWRNRHPGSWSLWSPGETMSSYSQWERRLSYTLRCRTVCRSPKNVGYSVRFCDTIARNRNNTWNFRRFSERCLKITPFSFGRHLCCRSLCRRRRPDSTDVLVGTEFDSKWPSLDWNVANLRQSADQMLNKQNIWSGVTTRDSSSDITPTSLTIHPFYSLEVLSVMSWKHKS